MEFGMQKIKESDILDCLIEEKKMGYKGGLYHFTQVKFAYNSNRIEGSKLTEDETRYIYETFTIGSDNKKQFSVNDIIETVNHFKCFDYMLSVAKEPLNENIIKEFHRQLKQSTGDSFKDWFKVGDYKMLANVAGGMETTDPVKVKKEKPRRL